MEAEKAITAGTRESGASIGWIAVLGYAALLCLLWTTMRG
jgi:hypothetical protein